MTPCRHPEFVPGCRPCWLARHVQRYRDLWGIIGSVSPVLPGDEYKLPTAIPLTRADRCEYVGRRVELVVGCNGMKCRWSCKLDLPAVPAGYCQTCTAYVPVEGEGWLS